MEGHVRCAVTDLLGVFPGRNSQVQNSSRFPDGIFLPTQRWGFVRNGDFSTTGILPEARNLDANLGKQMIVNRGKTRGFLRRFLDEMEPCTMLFSDLFYRANPSAKVGELGEFLLDCL